MNFASRTFTGVAMAALFATIPLSQAFALDQDAVLDRLKAVFAAQGTPVTWTEANHQVSSDGRDQFYLSGATLDINGQKMAFDSALVLKDVEENEDDDGYSIGALIVPSFELTQDYLTLWVGELSFKGVSLPPSDATPEQLASLMKYEGAQLSSFTAIVDGQQVAELRDLHVEPRPAQDGAPMEFSGALESFNVDLGMLKDPKQRAIAEELGYSKLSGYLEFAGSWQPTDGMVQVNHFEVSAVDAGTIGLSFEISGYTPDFVKSLRQAQAMMAANPNGDNSAAGLVILGLMQQLTFRNASIYFLDDTLTSRLLEFFAKQQGARPVDVANQAKAMVPFMMMQLNDPELTAMTSGAVSAFLDDPQSLQVVAKPAAPVPFAMIMAGAMSAPQALPKQLGVKIEANQ